MGLCLKSTTKPTTNLESLDTDAEYFNVHMNAVSEVSQSITILDPSACITEIDCSSPFDLDI